MVNKVKVKKRATPRPPAPTRVSIPRQIVPSVPKQMVHDVCAISNPFCEAARTAKIPDGNFQPTFAYGTRFMKTLTTNGSGDAAFFILPQMLYVYFVASMAGPIATFSGASGDSTGIAFNEQGYRITSFGVKVTPRCAPLNASGMIRVREYRATGSSLQIIDVDQPTPYMYNQALRDSRPISAIGARNVYADSVKFQTSSGDNPVGAIVSTTCGWNPVLIAVRGGPANTAVLDVEICFNYELVFSEDSGSNMMIATKAAPENVPVMSSALKVLDKVERFGNKVGEALDSEFGRAATQMLAQGFGYLLGGPTGAAAGTAVRGLAMGM